MGIADSSCSESLAEFQMAQFLSGWQVEFSHIVKLGFQASGDKTLKTQTRVKVKTQGHGRSDLPALRQAF